MAIKNPYQISDFSSSMLNHRRSASLSLQFRFSGPILSRGLLSKERESTRQFSWRGLSPKLTHIINHGCNFTQHSILTQIIERSSPSKMKLRCLIRMFL
ncbi:hypothetical protein GIB67_002422 [Kingdonia uniflora]|uniref:Uncharacterized protein n=1 Tax=Kingdonia uniflora TaxID=39325 RepID=A0A7J7MPG6_9MAGN|nr:hypothetical protein GIB67_002422 [Kingdonia uniflora]